MLAGVLTASVNAVSAPVPAQPAPAPERVNAFQDAMARQGLDAPAEPAAQAPVGASQQTAQADLDAQSRARQGLDLDGVAPAGETGGDMILDGIQRLRNVFDVREAHIGELMKGKVTDVNALMAMQMEVTNFTLLVDVSSKLTGKATQSFDTLMKGS
jgi:type III secretion system YscI/HrpB-like protein